VKSREIPQAAKPSKLSGVIISVVTILLSLLSLEGVLRLAWKDPYQWDRRLMFFSEGHNLRNTEWGGFAYQPNEALHAQTYYITNLDPPQLTKEYDYRFTSSSYGLIQLHELSAKKPAVLFLGDSFTEGQGARPWFYGLETNWPRLSQYQVVNGGILGSGVETWGRLYQDLSARISIAKAVIIYISDDWNRPLWQLSQPTLECLKAAIRCQGPEEFYGLPEDPVAAEAQINRIAQYRIAYLSQLRDSTSILMRSAVYRKLLVPTLRRLNSALRTSSFQSEASRQLEISKQIATNIVTRLGRDNVLFIYLPQRYELDAGPNWYGKKANEFIRKNGFAFVDGRAECGLTAGDYYDHDGHPNAGGYAKIAACVKRAVEGAFHPLPANR
jgi:hypothetical protein